jgi:protoheme IX farnesyltransferase
MSDNQTLTAATYKDSRVSDYVALLKPRVMSLVVFTGLVGLYLAPGIIHPFVAFVAIFCIALGSGAAGAINMWLERETDAKMKRTANRPLPAGRISPDSAIEFAVIMAFASVFIMGMAVNPHAALLLLSAIAFYVFVYTVWLKPRTPQNIVIGGASGAVPPMIGWAAVTGNLTVEPIILFLIIFMWTPPHFWALSLFSCKDYSKAGIPMLPVVSGERTTKIQMIFYTIGLIMVTLMPYAIGMSGTVYAIGAAVLGLRFLDHAFKVFKSTNDKAPRKMFKFSIAYLFLLFVLLVIDHSLIG